MARQLHIIVVYLGEIGGVLSLNQQIIRGEIGKEGIVRALSRRLRGAVLSFVGAAAVGRVEARIDLVIGVVIVLRFFADARGSGPRIGTCIAVLVLFVDEAFLRGIERVVDHRFQRINGLVVIDGIRAALGEEILHGEYFGMRLVMPLHGVGKACGLFFDIAVIGFDRIPIFSLFGRGSEIICHGVLHHDLAADEILHQQLKSLLVRIAVAVYIGIAGIEEISHQIAF